MYAKFISISAVEPFVLFLFMGDYFNIEMLKIFYLLRVYLKNVYFCMIFTFVFFFERSIQVPIKIPIGSIQDKEIEYFTFSIIHCCDYSLLGSTADFVIKKGTFRNFPGFCHLQTSETSDRNMAVGLDSEHPLLPKTGREDEDLNLILRKKWKHCK
jgi:hypothetical protein